MRHRRNTVKLGRTASHRDALLANMACSLITHKRIRTTLAKAKALRPYAEKLVTLGKRGDLHARRQVLAKLRIGTAHQKQIVKQLFEVVAPAAQDRAGGYTRITKLGPRSSDAAPMAYLEWVDLPVNLEGDETEEATSETAA
ncbi:MAG: 50S ribosomal protein L17 [Verrucomicrobiota bacterium]